MSDDVTGDKKTDLRLVGRSEDGSELELASQGGEKFTVRISDTLRATVNQPRLAAVVDLNSERSEVTVKDIQSRLRSGETIDAIVRTTDWSAEKIEKFSGPILQERAYVIEQALKSPLRREGNSQTLSEAAQSQLMSHGVDMEGVEWNTHRNHDGSWSIILHFPSREGMSTAQWAFDSARHTLIAQDDDARWIAGEEREQRPRTPTHGMVYPQDGATPPPSMTYPTHIPPPAPRLVAVREEIEVIESDDEVIEVLDLEIEEFEEVAPEERSDGVKSRPKLPSWDDIMFGGSSKAVDDPDNYAE